MSSATLRVLTLGCLLVAAGCFSPEATECPEGFFCPAGKYCAANQLVCIDENDSCGNGVVDTGEACDDGNIIDDDDCSRDCDSDNTCGNGTTDTAVGEVCDDGNTEDADDCSADCTSTEVCGNGIRDIAVDEACDDGNQDGNDGCNATCTSDETCGNGFTDVLIDDPEFCDDGNNEGGDECSADCKSGLDCGNGLIDPGEQCDGNGAGTGGETATCDADCTERLCGDGIVNATALEACDGDGLGNGGETAACDTDCTIRECGDSKLNLTGGEQCDLGPVSTVSCDEDCTVPACNDGVFNDPAEICDTGGNTTTCDSDCTLPACNDGIFNDPAEICDSGGNSASCDADCTLPECGDSVLNNLAGEQCEDGNTASNDNCVFALGCLLNICGDGWRDQQTPVLEACDGNNAGTGGLTAACDLDCSLPACNDGQFNNLAEFCESNGVNSAGCDSDCTAVACHDGIFNPFSEACDDNDTDNNDDCINSCALNNCGDGWRDLQGPVTEACDGNNAGTGGNTATCDADCTAPGCGDGVFNPQAEPCDDGNTNDRDDCIACAAAVCGDGFIHDQQSGTEVCDDGAAVNGDTTCPYGATSDTSPTCSLCNASCTADVGSLTGPYCGDDLVSNGESCDDNNGLACGACSDDCSQAQLAKAAGSMTVLGDDGLRTDGDRFTLNDGHGTVVTFEYDEDNDAGPGVIAIDHPNNATATQVAVLTRDAINAQTALRITATASGAVVTLAHDVNGSYGNQPITETVQNGGFLVSGMSGGKGLDCPLDTQCNNNNDCAPGLSCQSGTCQAHCGNGTTEAGLGEVCDDGNVLACGTCDDTCGTDTVPAAAVGSFGAVAKSLILDGETFTVRDGYQAAVIFEFDRNEAPDTDGTGVVLVDISAATTATEVAAAMRTAINGVGATLAVTASGATATVVLTNDFASALGNQPLDDTVTDAGFTNSDMAGGAAGDCAAGDGCVSDADCDPTLACDLVTGTCT